MRTPRLLFVFLLIPAVVFGQGGAPAAGAHKYALIVAIGDYPAGNGWPKISSVQDVGYLQKALTDQGFAAGDITVVKDGAATIEGIREAFAALTGKVKRGDVAVVHFSCHGEQVEADNNNKIDGLDECVVTYNAVSPLQSSDYDKDQAQYLRGHVLGRYLRALRAKLGAPGDLVVFMDDCHSGDGTRGLAKIRGGGPPLVSAHFNPGMHLRSDSSIISREEVKSGTDLASYEVFSAAWPEELDYETTDDRTGVGMGSLTYAICKSFESLGAEGGAPTYRELFARIQSIMNYKVPQQHPMFEGNGAERVLFGGKFVKQQDFVGIASVDKRAGRIVLMRGTLAGLDVGSRIAVYPAGTRDTAGKKAVGLGKIVSASAFSAVAVLDADIPFKQPADGWVFVTERIYKVEPVRVKADKEWRGVLVGDSAVRLVETDPELTLKGDSLKVSGNGYLFGIVTTDNLIDRLEAYARYKFLQNLSSTAPGLKVEVRLVLIKDGKRDTAATNRRIKGGRLETFEGDQFTIWIRNTGRKDAYVNILDLQPDGQINPVLPNRKMEYPINSHELKIPAGGDYFLPDTDVIGIAPPYGTEVYKVFVSPAEIDVQDLASTRGAGHGVMRAIEKLVRSSYNLSRGAEPVTLPNADVTMSEYIFLIKPKP